MSLINVMLQTVASNPQHFAQYTGEAGTATLFKNFPYTNKKIHKLKPTETYLFGGRIQLFFGARGFVYAARAVVDPLMPMAIQLVDCVNCRKWGTKSGAGEMAMKRISSSDTALDDTPSVWMLESAINHNMDCHQPAWAPHNINTVAE